MDKKILDISIKSYTIELKSEKYIKDYLVETTNERRVSPTYIFCYNMVAPIEYFVLKPETNYEGVSTYGRILETNLGDIKIKVPCGYFNNVRLYVVDKEFSFDVELPENFNL